MLSKMELLKFLNLNFKGVFFQFIIKYKYFLFYTIKVLLSVNIKMHCVLSEIDFYMCFHTILLHGNMHVL